ncbi:hypothetical protein PR048_027393 [Dryococelus australis]|uniref:Protein Wnt n=1 Tax=Dryococelus australis TaxID=614101 RepID=A0ABQ9GFC3_9NEOP|nr:hypothetical protein PR048_027393 [Dryococelus australis]
MKGRGELEISDKTRRPTASSGTILSCENPEYEVCANTVPTARMCVPGTREQAVVYALSSAAVAHTLARACAAGSLFHCSCAPPPREPPNGNFKWGGCGDNVRWAAHFGKQFTDSAERAAAKGKAGGGAKRGRLAAVNLHNNRAGRRVSPLSQPALSRVSLHRVWVLLNNANWNVLDDQCKGHGGGSYEEYALGSEIMLAAGGVGDTDGQAVLQAVESSLATQCKCHGVSGSCNIKTCWRALPRLLEVGERLKTKFAVATEVVHRRVGSGRRLLPASPAMGLFSDDDLIYVAKSPDYCLRDPRVGSQGTRGR